MILPSMAACGVAMLPSDLNAVIDVLFSVMCRTPRSGSISHLTQEQQAGTDPARVPGSLSGFRRLIPFPRSPLHQVTPRRRFALHGEPRQLWDSSPVQSRFGSR